MEKKFTVIDTKTQMISLIILCIGGYIVGAVFLGWLFDIRSSYICSSVIVVGLIILVIILFFISLKYSESNKKLDKHPDATEILNKRYAKGELTKEEYIQMKKDIEK